MVGQAVSAGGFREAEQEFAASLGIDITERMVDLPGPVGRARAITSGEGNPILLVHGGGGLAAQWLPLMARMDGRTAIAVDRPGCGLTEGFRYERGTDLRAHGVSFLEGTMDALGLERVDIVANSMGALWSLWLALDRPDRVSSLALIGCPAFILGTSAPLMLRMMSRPGLSWLMRRPQSADSFARITRMMGHPANEEHPLPDGFIEASVAGANIPGAAGSFVSLLQRCVGLRGGRPGMALQADDLSAIGVPVATVIGRNDPFGGPAVAEAVARATGGSSSVIGRGHLPWLDEPDGVAHVVLQHLSAVPA